MTHEPNTVDLNRHLPALLFKLSAKVAHHAHQLSARPHDLDMCEWRVILILGRDKTCSIIEVADRIHMDRGGTSRAISRLEKRGYVERHNDPGDRRRSRVSLTQKGWELHAPLADFSAEREAVMKSCLSAQEDAALIAALAKLETQIDQMLST